MLIKVIKQVYIFIIISIPVSPSFLNLISLSPRQKQYIVFPPEENAVDEATTQKLSDQIQKLKEKGEE